MLTETLSQTPPLQVAGLLGAGLYMMNYTLLTSRILTSDNPAYFGVNLAAALLVLSSLSGAFNAATLVIQVFFVGVSLCGIFLRLRRGGASKAREAAASKARE